MRATLSAIVFVIAALALAGPAQAAVTAAMTATTPSYSGTCPTTMAFTGNISGPPGTAFQYSFNRYVNGIQQVQNVGAATLPASGSLAVSDSFSIGSTSSGSTNCSSRKASACCRSTADPTLPRNVA